MTTLVLHEFHAALGARFRELETAEMVADYGNPEAEYRAFRETAGVIDLSGRGRLVLLGADRQKFLNGQVTNNVKDLRPGQGCYAALVNAKAKLVADLNVFVLEGELLLDVEPGRAGVVAARLEQFVIADDVQVVDAAPLYGLLGVYGPRAERVVEALGLFPTVPATTLEHQVVHDATLGDVYLANHPRLGNRGFDLFVPKDALAAVADRLIAAARDVGGRVAGWEAFDLVRVEAGIPRFGVDMNETNLAPESGLEERAISYQKGCYIGQEVIARIRTYGQVAKALRGLRLSIDRHHLPPAGTKLLRDGKEVGYLTSCVWSPTLGTAIALGYVRRECNGPGIELDLAESLPGARATIVALPFVGPQFA